MSKREYFLRFLHIINKLKKGPATYEEIVDYLDRQSELQGYDFRLSNRTLQRDIVEIRSIFNIDIKYDFSKKGYFIAEELKSDSNARMLEAFEMFNALNLTDELTQHIQFEKRKPEGTEYFYGILHAIKNNLQIKIEYFKYEAEKTVHRALQPLLLKESKSRWYVLANDPDDGFTKTYGLDRIRDLEITKKKFIRPDNFDPSTFFKDCFGIIRPTDSKSETIILSFDPLQGRYVKSFPLHESQQIIVDNEDETQIQLALCITYDFVMELLQYGDRVKVLKPKSLKKELLEIYSRAVKENK
jgi:predicted DNA-binding transcriptional regulator YafY